MKTINKQFENFKEKTLNQKENINVLIKPLRENFILPIKATENSACFDVFASHIEMVSEREAIIYLGFALDIPTGYYLSLKPRSSLTKTNWIIQNSPGVGDADYRGEYQFRFKALPIGIDNGKLIYDPFPYNVGDRVGQIQIEKTINISFIVTNELSNTTRGEGGFGSTGK